MIAIFSDRYDVSVYMDYVFTYVFYSRPKMLGKSLGKCYGGALDMTISLARDCNLFRSMTRS